MREDGFTLIEMMIVLMIISILLLITIPNLTDNNQTVRDKGCEALVKLSEAQIQAYEIKNNQLPASLDDLVAAGYLTTTECPNGTQLALTNGKVVTVE